jgi:hypothetical protein
MKRGRGSSRVNIYQYKNFKKKKWKARKRKIEDDYLLIRKEKEKGPRGERKK